MPLSIEELNERDIFIRAQLSNVGNENIAGLECKHEFGDLDKTTTVITYIDSKFDGLSGIIKKIDIRNNLTKIFDNFDGYFYDQPIYFRPIFEGADTYAFSQELLRGEHDKQLLAVEHEDIDKCVSFCISFA